MLRLSYVQTFIALVSRDMNSIMKQLPGRMIDGTVIVFMQTLAIGQFLPLLGMPSSLIAPLFIGTMTQIIFSAAFAVSFRYANDLNANRFINYQITLPLPKTWLFAQIIFSFMIEIAFISLPLIFLGSIFLGSSFPLNNASWIATFGVYIASVIFYALLFIFLAFNSPYTWFLDNVWARRLSPLFLLGCAYFTWKKLYAFNAVIALFLLVNPLTYIHEGLRAALLGSEDFLSVKICLPMIIIFCIILVVLLANALSKRLDPV